MNHKQVFWRTVFISSVIIFNLLLLAFGISAAYQNIYSTFYGKDQAAVEINEEEIRILDFTLTKSA